MTRVQEALGGPLDQPLTAENIEAEVARIYEITPAMSDDERVAFLMHCAAAALLDRHCNVNTAARAAIHFETQAILIARERGVTINAIGSA